MLHPHRADKAPRSGAATPTSSVYSSATGATRCILAGLKHSGSKGASSIPVGAEGGGPPKLPELLGPSPEGTEPDARMGSPFMLGEGDCSGDAEGDRSCSGIATLVACLHQMGFNLPMCACVYRDCRHAQPDGASQNPKQVFLHWPRAGEGPGAVSKLLGCGSWQDSQMQGPFCRSASTCSPH